MSSGTTFGAIGGTVLGGIIAAIIFPGAGAL